MDYLAVLQRLGGGQTLEDLCAALEATAEEVVAMGKPGKVVLTLTISNKSQGDVLVMVDETIARTSPKKDPRGQVFYSVGGALHRNDPRQTVMDLRSIDTATGEIREVAGVRSERSVT